MRWFYSAALLFLAAPLPAGPPERSPWADPQPGPGFHWFTLTEKKAEVAQLLGPPVLSTAVNADFDAWQYQIGDVADEDFSHYILFRKSDGVLVSIARNYDPERTVDQFFPAEQTSTLEISLPDGGHYAIRARRLSGQRVLMAMGVADPGQKTGQLVLMNEAVVPRFYPALTEQISHLRAE